MTHIYAFGSVCRGDIDPHSDVDILAVTESHKGTTFPKSFSTYRYDRLTRLWKDGSAFAWHLHRDAKLVYASNETDFLASLGIPGPYLRASDDCRRFRALCARAIEEIESESASLVFELSMVFLAIRNFSTCYGLGYLNIFEFSRSAALRLGDRSIPIGDDHYRILERSRLISTRAVGAMVTPKEIESLKPELATILIWMDGLMNEVGQ